MVNDLLYKTTVPQKGKIRFWMETPARSAEMKYQEINTAGHQKDILVDGFNSLVDRSPELLNSYIDYDEWTRC